MNATIRSCVLLLCSLGSAAQAADLKFAPIFSDGVVAQRNQKIPVWGQGDPNATVEVGFGPQHATATVGADGWWRVDLNPLPAGGPYTLTAAAAGKNVAVQDVLCGDVWLCSGQSNMQMTTRECVGGEKAAAEVANYPSLRLLTVGKGGADEPQQTFQKAGAASWKHATPETAAKFSAVGYFFGLTLLKDPALKGVPIGLIDSSFGGTSGEAWTPKQELAWMQPDQRSGSMFEIAPSSLYNAMIAPLAPSGLSGVVWYQGEANAGKPEVYPKILSSLIAGWRRQWNLPNLPFFIVELPPYLDKFGPHYFTWLREAQGKVAKTVPHVDLVTTVNTTDGSNLHPKTKQEIGRRAALLARRDVYGEKIVAQGPVFKDARVDGARLRVAFDTAGRGLVSRNSEELGGFQLAGADGAYYFADATIVGDEVVLESKRVPAPKTVRYAWTAVPRADLVNQDGLPAAPFRTDELPPTDNEFQPTPVVHRLTTKNIDLTVDDRGDIKSLGIGGQQFLSNSFRNSGGTSVFVGKGNRELTNVEEVQPGLLRFRDNETSVEITGDDFTTTWTITNDNKEDVKFQLMLASGVTVTKQDNALLLERFYTKAKIDGVWDVQKPGSDGQPVVTVIPPHSTGVIKITREK